MPQTLLPEYLFPEFGLRDWFVSSADSGEDNPIDRVDSIYDQGLCSASVLLKYHQSKSGKNLSDAMMHVSLATSSNVPFLTPDNDLEDHEPIHMDKNNACDYSDEDLQCIEAQVESSVKRKRSLYKDIYRIYRECSEPDWDGYDAIPVSGSTFSKAQELVKLLPINLPLPEAMPEPTGEIAFEWYRDKKHVFVASVGDENVISYAGLFGNYSQTWFRIFCRANSSITYQLHLACIPLMDAFLEENISDNEPVCRFITGKDYYRTSDGTVRHNAFMQNREGEASVYRIIDLMDDEIFEIGRLFVAEKKGKPLKGRADIRVAKILENKLRVDSQPDPHPRHANIVGWPEDKSEIKVLALQLAANATLALIKHD